MGVQPEEKVIGWSLLSLPAGVLAADRWVEQQGGRDLVQAESVRPAQAILVPGAYVHPRSGPSDILCDRLQVALQLYQAGKAPRILLSGDHQHANYDEVGGMRRYLEERGVPGQDLFLDHAGLDTYDSIYRALRSFRAENLIVCTQRFQLVRALFIARQLGLPAQGVCTDLHRYLDYPALRRREVGARCKAVWDCWRRRPSKVSGDRYDLMGDGRATHRKGDP